MSRHNMPAQLLYEMPFDMKYTFSHIPQSTNPFKLFPDHRRARQNWTKLGWLTKLLKSWCKWLCKDAQQIMLQRW